MGMRVGYARVSIIGQKLDVQLNHLADCDRIYREKASASSRQGKEKGSTFALLTDAPDGSAVPMDDLLHCGQADAGSGILSGVM